MNLDGNQASIREVCDAGLLSGAVTMVWQREKLLQVNEIGYRDIDAGVPMQRDTLFRIASMTKPVTVAAAMSLVDEGKLALRDPITRWAPELCKVAVLDDAAGPLDRTHPARRAILIEDLLTHTSGLAYGFSVSGPISRAYQRLPFGQGPDVWLAALATLPLVHQPGDRVTYSHAIDVLGVIVSRIEDAPLYQIIDERVLGPAGMTDTGFYVSADAQRRAATMYRLDEQDRLRHDVMGPPHVTPPSFCNAGGGLWSTADDYLRFVRMLLGDGTVDGVRVLSPESVRLMRRPADRRAETAQLSGGAVLGGPRLRAEPIGGDRSGEVQAAVRAGRARDLQLARRVRDMVAGRPERRPDTAVSDPALSRSVRGRCRGRRG